VRSIMAHQHNGDHFSRLLPEVYYYSIKGENAHSFIDHITENEANIKNGYRQLIKSKKRQQFNLVSFAFKGYYPFLCPRIWTGLFLLFTCTCWVVPVSPSVWYGAGDSELSVISLPSKVCTPLN